MASQVMTDETLIRAVADGDERAISSLYDRHAPRVYALALRILRQRGVAEEIVQETLLRVWRAAPTYEGGHAGFSAWLMRIARNLCIDELRRQSARPKVDDPMPAESDEDSDLEAVVDTAADVAQAAWDRIMRMHVQQALAELPVDQRLALELAYFEGLSHREIAEHLNSPLGTVKTRLRLGLQKLAERFAQQDLEV